MEDKRRALGAKGEDTAAAFLRSRGYQVLARNVRRREGEIDIVATRDGLVAFVEVKTRRGTAYGEPAEAVTYRKQARIRRLALAMLTEGMRARDVRFDVIEVRSNKAGMRVRHIEGAF